METTKNPQKKPFSPVAALLIGVLLVWVIQTVYPIVSAYTWAASDATVVLSGDVSEYHGTLRRDPWSDNYLLEQADGSIVMFGKDRFAMMTWPLPGASTEAK